MAFTYKYNDKGYCHCEDGPALITDICEYWYYNGLLHREYGPAVIEKISGKQYWYCHGKIHRDNGPAFIDARNNKEYYYVMGELFQDKVAFWHYQQQQNMWTLK